MKAFLKIVLGIALLAVVLLGGGVSWLALRRPAQQPPLARRIEATPQRVARGEYLVHHVADCVGCHSDHHLDRFGFPVKAGTIGQGGFPFTKELGLPGVVCAQNITPDRETGIGSWTDGEILRAIREGVDRNGDALFPMMPYTDYHDMSDEDAKSVVTYLRTLTPVKNSVPKKQIDFPVNLFVKFAPKPVTAPKATPDDAKDHHAYGQYLVTIGGCVECHTPHDDKGQRLAGQEFSGGWEMRGPWGRVRTANLTPHPATFVGRSTKAEFIGRFKSFAGFNETTAPKAGPGSNTVMPWLAFAGMTDQDLGAIYDYLRTVKPVQNAVVTFPDRK
jgi:mono/diheme cytochrome c family protein